LPLRTKRVAFMRRGPLLQSPQSEVLVKVAHLRKWAGVNHGMASKRLKASGWHPTWRNIPGLRGRTPWAWKGSSGLPGFGEDIRPPWCPHTTLAPGW
jgi:hypothetical protein